MTRDVPEIAVESLRAAITQTPRTTDTDGAKRPAHVSNDAISRSSDHMKIMTLVVVG